MNIMFQVAGFAVMIIIFIFYFSDRAAAVKSNKLFLWQSIAITTSVVIDIFSIVAICTPELSFSFLSYFLARAYCISCLVVVSIALLYVLLDTGLSKKNSNIIKIIAGVLFITGSVLAIILPLEIHPDYEGLNNYTAGLAITITFVIVFIIMALTLGVAISKRKQMYKKRFYGVCIFLGIWVLGAGIQALVNYGLGFLNVTILCISFAETLGSLVIYMMLENPSFNVDRVTGSLNQRALEEYLQDCYKKKLKIGFILIDYDTTVSSSIMGYNSFSKALTDLLREYGAKKIFKNDKDNFIVIREYDTKASIEESIDNFKDEIYQRNNIKTEIPFKIFYYKDISLFYDENDLIRSITYIVDKSKFTDKRLIEVNKRLANEVHQKFVMDKKCDLAFSNRNIEVFYQPIYSNQDSAFTAAEALVRLRDEDGNLIYPGDFIEEMERDGRIVELGKIVFEDVCKFISENDMEKLGLHYIEVNLSAVQCMQDRLASTYISIMKKYKVNPKYINLEITETAQSTRKTLLRNMQILREYGVSFSLDDFGTGNSNLNYIVEMPVEIVKFDKSMVTSYFENRIASFVMNSTIDMIKSLGHKIVFEGVEEEAQIFQVKLMKVDYVQGYFYSKPIDQYSFIQFIDKHNNKKEDNVAASIEESNES